MEFFNKSQWQKSKGTYWVSLLIDRNAAVYFDSFSNEYIPQGVLSKFKNKSITHDIFKMQFDDSVICGFYCTISIELKITGKALLDYIN